MQGYLFRSTFDIKFFFFYIQGKRGPLSKTPCQQQGASILHCRLQIQGPCTYSSWSGIAQDTGKQKPHLQILS